MTRTLLALSVFAGSLFGQERVAPENLCQRILCVVPMIRTGTVADPRRLVPAPSPLTAPLVSANMAVKRRMGTR
jgi:hypothetical protein